MKQLTNETIMKMNIEKLLLINLITSIILLAIWFGLLIAFIFGFGTIHACYACCFLSFILPALLIFYTFLKDGYKNK